MADITTHLEWHEGPRFVGVSSAASNRNISISGSVQLTLDAIIDSRIVVSALLARRVAAALVAAADRLEHVDTCSAAGRGSP